VSLRVSPVSRIAAILIVILGLFTLTVSYPGGEVIGEIMGVAFVVLGLVLYGMLYKVRSWVERELDGREGA